jgi:hypothetical protein
VIDTQGSVILNVSQEEEDNSSDQRKKADGMMKPEVRQKSTPIFERRVNERLKKDLGIRIEEKSRRMYVKRSLEGNIHKSKSNFSCLSSIKIIDISKKMGVTMSNQNLDFIDLLKEMELARQCLFDYAKKRKILLLEKLKSPGEREMCPWAISKYFGD